MLKFEINDSNDIKTNSFNTLLPRRNSNKKNIIKKLFY